MTGKPEDILRLLYCPNCRYDLRSLPAAHTCPECGFVYDETMFSIPTPEVDEISLPLPRTLWQLGLSWFLRFVLFGVIPGAIFLTAYWFGVGSKFYYGAALSLLYWGLILITMRLYLKHSLEKRKQTGADQERSLYCIDVEGFLLPREGMTPKRWKWIHFHHATAKKWRRFEDEGVFYWRIRIHRPKWHYLLLLDSRVFRMKGDENQAEQIIARINTLIKAAGARTDE